MLAFKGGACYGEYVMFTGDGRVNVTPALSAVQTIWLRLHNVLEPIIGRENPDLTGEDRFQHTRRFVTALWQKVIFEDLLKVVLGPTEHSRYQLRFNQGRYTEKLDPRLDTEFATSAFRMGHSYVPNFLPFQERSRLNDPVMKKLSNVSLSYFSIYMYNREWNLHAYTIYVY